MTERVIIACDVSSREELTLLLNKFTDPQPQSIKVGMELFYQEGPSLVRELKEQGYHLFLDLKLHDIPTTVYKAMRGLAKLGVDMINVHAAGGSEMMKAAIRGLEEGTASDAKRPVCLAVTQLTSADQTMLHDELLINKSIDDVILAYSQTAYQSGLDGVVCSPWESAAIKQHVSGDFLTVTPGIRLPSDSANDQKRIATPSKARELQCDYIVVGRSITQANDPQLAFENVLTQWRNA